MRRFYSPPQSFADGSVTISEDETRHLRDVLRLKPGDDVSTFDGCGREFHCVVTEIGKKNSVLKVIGEIEPASPESPLDLTIAATVLNGEKYDLIVQKAVELGVTALLPLITIRCDVRAADAARRLTRWRRVAMEATKQTGRATLMSVFDPMTFEQLVSKAAPSETVLFSERSGRAFSFAGPTKKLTALFGPKGGWDDVELSLAAEAGLSIVTLGGRILRAETASIAITAILQHRFGDLN